jgi:hypothetical protein
MTYRAIAASETNPQAPITAALMKALDANLDAVAEGATGAPRVQGRALGGIHVGPAQAFSSGVAATVLDCDGVGDVDVDIAQSTWNGSINVTYSNNNGASWGATQVVTGSQGLNTGKLRINLQTGAYTFSGLNLKDSGGNFTGSLVSGSGTHTVPSDCNAFYINGGGLTSGSAIFAIIGGIE